MFGNHRRALRPRPLSLQREMLRFSRDRDDKPLDGLAEKEHVHVYDHGYGQIL